MHRPYQLKKVSAEGAGVLDRSEPGGETRMIFHRFERRFRKRVVIRHVRTRMRSQDVQVGEEIGDLLRGHRGATVGVHGLWNTMQGDNHVGDEPCRELGGFGGRDVPAHDVAAEMSIITYAS
jgi:hypothetical protein